MTHNAAPLAEPECGLIFQQDGKPQQMLAKFLNLLLNYQYGLSLVTTQQLGKAATLALLQRNICCAFAIQNQVLPDRSAIASLSRQGAIPLFLVMPQKALDPQRQICEGMSNLFFCAWEMAFTSSESSLQQIVSAVLEEKGIGNLFRELDEVPYAELQERLERRLRKINTLPTIPEIVVRIMRLVSDPKTTVRQLEEVLCRDPAIVMKLLQVVRSPIFSSTSRQRSWTLSEAIVRLGLKKVGAIAQQIKMINSLVKPEESGFDLRRYWEHSVGCAIIADQLCERRLVPLPETVAFNEYWIAALLHDIGKLVLGFFFWDWFSRVLDQAQKTQGQFRQAEIQLGDIVSHERIAQLLMVNAAMGETLAAVAGSHHSVGDNPKSLVCLVHLADQLCKEIGFGYGEEEVGVFDKRVLGTFRLDKQKLKNLQETLVQGIPAEIKNMVDLCLR